MKVDRISTWIEGRLANGHYSFTLDFLREEFSSKTEVSLKSGLARLVKQKRIISVVKGFYIIIPPSYRNMGILPPVMFVDDMMRYWGRPYYISLLSAASIFGAAHQQPQAHYICTNLPSVRTTAKKGILIKYVSKRKFSDIFIIQKKTETGYVNVSNPLLTCIELIDYHKAIGGIGRAATIINELSDEVVVDEIGEKVLSIASRSDLQRLGYIWEHLVDKAELADKLFGLISDQSAIMRTCRLLSSKSLEKKSKPNRWAINVNTIIEIDE